MMTLPIRLREEGVLVYCATNRSLLSVSLRETGERALPGRGPAFPEKGSPVRVGLAQAKGLTRKQENDKLRL